MTQEGTHIILHKETGKYFNRAVVLGVDDLWKEVVVEEAEEGAGGEDAGPEAAPQRPVARQQVQAGPFHPLADQSCTPPALYRKSDLYIPRNETARPRSQFLHSLYL
jgi:hypothetical protein